ncbi:MAG TPA: GNAT family N-acetyltransferase [Aggregatilineaceae bacterium]|nr:GNAT family N-acetyltransferase [Aggregatilineaceae bacterium]
MTVTFEHATLNDVPALVAVQTRCFDDDSQRFLGTESGGPPGYDSAPWQIDMLHKATAYLKIVEDGRIIGGMIIFRARGNAHYELGRIYLDPACQNRGIGTLAMRHLEKAFPQVKRWTLGTPIWATRNHHFYEKLGYQRVRQSAEDVFYVKRL